jgi:hypothetical protein
MLLSPPGTDGMVASRDMEVVLPIDDSVGGWVVMHPPVVHHADNNQCGNQTTDQKLHASSGALGPKPSVTHTTGHIQQILPQVTRGFIVPVPCNPIYKAQQTDLLYLPFPLYICNMPADFFHENPSAERYVWIEFFRYTGWEVDDLLAAPMGIVINLVETIHLEVLASSLDQAQEWANDCQHYAGIKGWNPDWFFSMTTAWHFFRNQANNLRTAGFRNEPSRDGTPCPSYQESWLAPYGLWFCALLTDYSPTVLRMTRQRSARWSRFFRAGAVLNMVIYEALLFSLSPSNSTLCRTLLYTLYLLSMSSSTSTAAFLDVARCVESLCLFLDAKKGVVPYPWPVETETFLRSPEGLVFIFLHVLAEFNHTGENFEFFHTKSLVGQARLISNFGCKIRDYKAEQVEEWKQVLTEWAGSCEVDLADLRVMIGGWDAYRAGAIRRMGLTHASWHEWFDDNVRELPVLTLYWLKRHTAADMKAQSGPGRLNHRCKRVVLQCEKLGSGLRVGRPYQGPTQRMGCVIQNVHVHAGWEHMGASVAAGIRCGPPGLDYIRTSCTYHYLYLHRTPNMSTFSASLSDEQLIASMALHLDKEGHDAEAFWASPLDAQKQAVQFLMDVLTGTGHEEILQSLKEWCIDATLGTTKNTSPTTALTFFVEPISPRALITWMEFQDDLDICGQLDGETYVRAYLRLRDTVPDVFTANPLSPTAAVAHLDAIQEAISGCVYPLNTVAFPWLRPLVNVSSCWKGLLATHSIDARIPASVICNLWINRPSSPQGAQISTGPLDRNTSMEPADGPEHAYDATLSPVSEGEDKEANLSSTPKPPNRRSAMTKHSRQRLNAIRKKGAPLSPIVTALSRSPSISSLSSGHTSPGTSCPSVRDRMDRLVQAIQAVTSDEGPDSFEFLSSLSATSALPKALLGLSSYMARAGLQSNNAALSFSIIPPDVTLDIASLRDHVKRLDDTVATLRRQNFADQDTIRSLRASMASPPLQRGDTRHAPTSDPRSREFLAQFVPGRKRKQITTATTTDTATQAPKKQKTDTILVGETTNWTSLRDKAGVMASLNGKADFTTVSKVLDLYTLGQAATPTPPPSTSLQQTTLEGDTLTREEACKAEAKLGPNIKKISIPAPAPRSRLTKASAVPLPRNSARVVMFWLMPGKTAPSEASLLTEEAVHAKLVHFASGRMLGRDKLAESLAVERMEWTTDCTALRVWFQSRPEEDVLACIASEGSGFLFGEGWGAACLLYMQSHSWRSLPWTLPRRTVWNHPLQWSGMKYSLTRTSVFSTRPIASWQGT